MLALLVVMVVLSAMLLKGTVFVKESHKASQGELSVQSEVSRELSGCKSAEFIESFVWAFAGILFLLCVL